MLINFVAATACVEERSEPDYGRCSSGASATSAIYGIGSCMAAPTDLKLYVGADDLEYLLITNSNSFMTFRSGSLVALPLHEITQQLDDIKNGLTLTDSEYLVPAVINIADLSASALEMPNFIGKSVTTALPDDQGCQADPELGGCPVALISNRYSSTSLSYANDSVYAVDLSDPQHLELFDISGAGDSSFPVAEDPYGMVVGTSTKGKYLYVVNESGHSVSVVDLNSYPIRQIDADTVGVVTAPEFSDVGESSFAEITHVNVSGNILNEDWTLSYVEGSYRAWYLAPQGDDDALYVSESGDGQSFLEPGQEPLLTRGDSDAWDSSGLGDATVLLLSDRYELFYEGFAGDTNQTRRIGRATTLNYEQLAFEKFDVGADGSFTNDYLLNIGTDGSFDEGGVGEPHLIYRADSNLFVLFYTGFDEAQSPALGLVTSEDLETFSNRAVLRFFTEYDSSDNTYSSEFTFDRTHQATGFFSTETSRYRVWFMAEIDGSTRLSYAEAPLLTLKTDEGSGASYAQFKLGRLEQEFSVNPCLDLPLDEGETLDNPSVTSDAQAIVAGNEGVLQLWYVVYDAEKTQAKVRQAQSFDGLTWYPVDSDVTLEVPVRNGESQLTVLKTGVGNTFRMVGEDLGTATTSIVPNALAVPLYDSSNYPTLTLEVIQGHVLGSGSSVGVKSNPDSQYLVSDDVFYDVPWDYAAVSDPAYDSLTDSLFYVGTSADNATALGRASADNATNAFPRWVNGPAALTSDQSVDSPSLASYGNSTWIYYLQTSESNAESIVRSEFSSSDPTTLSTPEIVLEPESDETIHAISVLPPRSATDRWHLWFMSNRSGESEILYASSPDGSSWERSERVVLSVGNLGDWDDVLITDPEMVRRSNEDGGVDYFLYYTGYSGSAWRIGVATAHDNGTDELSALEFTRYQPRGAERPQPVLSGRTDGFDEGGVFAPAVVWDTDRFRLWYEGFRQDSAWISRRIGYAESFDGFTWTRLYRPLTSGDSFQFRTAKIINGTESQDRDGEVSNLTDGVINLDTSVEGQSFSGNGSTEIAIAPDGSIAVATSRFAGGIYVVDTRDDSQSDMFFDANFLGLEAIMTYLSNNGQSGTRSVTFSPDGSRIYLTTAYPDSILILDRSVIADGTNTELLDNVGLISTIELEPGIHEDAGAPSSGDLGPLSPVISENGRYLFVANGNANSVTMVDLALAKEGQGIKRIQEVGEQPAALCFSGDGKYLFVANFVGDYAQLGTNRWVNHSTIAIIDSDETSPIFGQVIAWIKNFDE